MKKYFLLMILVAACCGLKAQNRFPLKPSDSLYQKYFKKLPDSLLAHFPALKLKLMKGQLKDSALRDRLYAYDHMPVLKPNFYSRMPVAKLHNNSKMPVIDPYTHERLELKKPEATVVIP